MASSLSLSRVKNDSGGILSRILREILWLKPGIDRRDQFDIQDSRVCWVLAVKYTKLPSAACFVMSLFWCTLWNSVNWKVNFTKDKVFALADFFLARVSRQGNCDSSIHHSYPISLDNLINFVFLSRLRHREVRRFYRYETYRQADWCWKNPYYSRNLLTRAYIVRA